MNIQLIHRKKLDTHRWNEAVNSAVNGRVYALSPLLDAMCNGHWSALVINDYGCIVPLTHKNKYLFKMINQPLFMQQLGLFYSADADVHIQEIISYLIKNYSYGNIYFTEELTQQIATLTTQPDCKWKPRNNFILELHKTYDELYAAFSTNCKRNIKKAKNEVVSEITPEMYLDFYLENKFYQKNGITGHDISKLIAGIKNNNNIFNYHIFAVSHENKISGAAVYLVYRDRITYISGASTPHGIEKKSMFAIKNHLIRKYSNTSYILDFEGSNTPSIADFFKGFGGTCQVYMHMHVNRLGWLLNKLIR